ncbi:CT398-like coiled coil hairpin domain-containing protein, partial [Streptomyces fradiae]|uniref:CT398-like coiled coil hairpin domain-containing protein n=1 Tax=Streptomyces fradiae TaxID=1906 RepID=UPI003F4CCF0B
MDLDQPREAGPVPGGVDLRRGQAERAVRDQQRLDSGAVSSPKDLENLQREIVSLS